jgi:hypothetical protein
MQSHHALEAMQPLVQTTSIAGAESAPSTSAEHGAGTGMAWGAEPSPEPALPLTEADG